MDLYNSLHGQQLSLMNADRPLTASAKQAHGRSAPNIADGIGVGRDPGAPMAPLDPVT
jgi:hypothetical protein